MATMLAATGGPGARWMTYRDGMDTLARRLADRLPVTTGACLAELTEQPGAVRLRFADGRTLTARQAVLALPAALALHPAMPADERPFLTRPPRRIDYAGDWLPLHPNSESAAHSATHPIDRLLADSTTRVPAAA
ncbi:hypothetical protein P3T36_001957 [Kitasatospora sp. MAP12-15]|nr:hypothetical protein [Kitasatospora sp. MAP12-44]